MTRILQAALCLALTLGGSQVILAESGKSKLNRRWIFSTGLNASVPTGLLDYPAIINPSFDANNPLVSGGFSFLPSFSFCAMMDYDQSFTKSGMHGFIIGFGYTEREEKVKYNEYIIYYQGIIYTQEADKRYSNSKDFELRLAYRFRFNRISTSIGAFVLIHSNFIFSYYEISGHHYENVTSHWWKLDKWYPNFKMDYHFFTKNAYQLSAFILTDRRGIKYESVNWWDFQIGLQISICDDSKRR